MINLQNNPRVVDIDGSILWVIGEYTHDEWMHTFTRLNKFCFLITQESEFLPYIEVVARTYGAYCSNLKEFLEYYEEQGWVISEERRGGDKMVYQLTECGWSKVSEVVSEEQSAVLSECLDEWEEKSNLSLIEEVSSAYPGFNL
jgi:hypothetical protein